MTDFIENLEVGIGRKKLYPLNDNLYILVYSSKDGIITKTFKARKKISGKVWEETIGKFPNISYKEALKQKDKFIDELKKEAKKPKIITLNDLFDEYQKNQEARELQPRTIIRTRQNFNKLKPIADKNIKNIKDDEIIKIFDDLYHKKQHEVLRKVIQIARNLFNTARDLGYIEKNPMLSDTSLKQRYQIRKKKYSTLNSLTIAPLIELLKAIESYRGENVTKNLLIFTLLIPLRSYNARNLKITNIKTINDKPVIEIQAENFKTDKEKNTYIGIYPKMENWLKSIYRENENNYIFILPKKYKPVSENTPNKAIKGMKIKGIEGSRNHLNFHSLRSVFSSYANENGINNRDIEMALTHKIGGVEGHYNRSSGIEKSRTALSWWFDFIKNLCEKNNINFDVFKEIKDE